MWGRGGRCGGRGKRGRGEERGGAAADSVHVAQTVRSEKGIETETYQVDAL